MGSLSCSLLLSPFCQLYLSRGGSQGASIQGRSAILSEGWRGLSWPLGAMVSLLAYGEPGFPEHFHGKRLAQLIDKSPALFGSYFLHSSGYFPTVFPGSPEASWRLQWDCR